MNLTPLQLTTLQAARDGVLTRSDDLERDYGTWRIEGGRAVTATVRGLIVRKLLRVAPCGSTRSRAVPTHAGHAELEAHDA